MAPEVITVTKDNQEGYDMKADIWSLGITAIEMAEGTPPLFEIASLRVIFLIPVREPPTFKEPNRWTPEFVDFLSTCLQKDARKRPSSTDLLKHPFIVRGLQKEALLKDLVNECIPLLAEARLAKKDKEKKEEPTDTRGYKSGTIITINNSTRKFKGTVGSASGTTVINRDDYDDDDNSDDSDSYSDETDSDSEEEFNGGTTKIN